MSDLKIRDHRDILLAPVVSEKSYGLLDENKYTFRVSPAANKTEIKIAVEAVFGVKVTGVNTIVVKGKSKFFRGVPGKRSISAPANSTPSPAPSHALTNATSGCCHVVLPIAPSTLAYAA